MHRNIDLKIEEYLLSDGEKEAYEILSHYIDFNDFENCGTIFEEQLPDIKDYSFEKLCSEIRNGNFFLAISKMFTSLKEGMIRNNQSQDGPSDEDFQRVICILFTRIVVQGIYVQYGLNFALEVVDCFQTGFRRVFLLYVFPKPVVILDHCERIKDDLLRIHNEREFFYWDKSYTELQKLYDMLKDRGLIKENTRFIESFRKEIVPDVLRTEWTGHGSELVFLTYYLFKNLFGASFYKKTYSLFYIKDVSYTIDFLRQTYHHIKNEFDHPKDFPGNREELLEIIRKIGIDCDI